MAINLSTAEIITIYTERRALYNTIGYRQQELRREQTRTIKTLAAIEELPAPCSPNDTSRFLRHFTNFSAPILQDLLLEDFNNPQLMHLTSCLVNTMIDMPPIPVGNTENLYGIHEWFRQARFITMLESGQNQVLGLTVPSENKESKAVNLLIGRTPRSPADDNLAHELLIGRGALNSLRGAIPNFVYTYAGFFCSPLKYGLRAQGESKQVKDWCSSIGSGSTNYILIENITPSITLAEALKTVSLSEFLNIYLQVLYALHYAGEACDFTHYDLHPGNVLLRKLPQAMQIQYSTENGEEYLLTSNVATIIDFGLSHVRIGTEHYGTYGYYPYGVMADTRWLYHDAYKLLMTCLYLALSLKRQWVKDLGQLFRFFNTTDDLVYALEQQSVLAYGLPRPARLGTTEVVDDLHHFTTYIRETLDCKFIQAGQWDNIPVLAPNEEAEDIVDLARYIGMDIEDEELSPPHSLFLLCSMLIDLNITPDHSNGANSVLAYELTRNFDYTKALTYEYEQVNREATKPITKLKLLRLNQTRDVTKWLIESIYLPDSVKSALLKLYKTVTAILS